MPQAQSPPQAGYRAIYSIALIIAPEYEAVGYSIATLYPISDFPTERVLCLVKPSGSSLCLANYFGHEDPFYNSTEVVVCLQTFFGKNVPTLTS